MFSYSSKSMFCYTLSCHHSPYQRFKGVWVLDPALDNNGISIHCRNSQMKYNSVDSNNAFQKTVEVCTWNKKLRAQLSIRIVQVRRIVI